MDTYQICETILGSYMVVIYVCSVESIGGSTYSVQKRIKLECCTQNNRPNLSPLFEMNQWRSQGLVWGEGGVRPWVRNIIAENTEAVNVFRVSDVFRVDSKFSVLKRLPISRVWTRKNEVQIWMIKTFYWNDLFKKLCTQLSCLHRSQNCVRIAWVSIHRQTLEELSCSLVAHSHRNKTLLLSSLFSLSRYRKVLCLPIEQRLNINSLERSSRKTQY